MLPHFVECRFQLNELGYWECEDCKWVYPIRSDEPPRRRCVVEKQIKPGPGNRLHEILCERFNLNITEGCDCRKRINMMNAWGPQGCRENLDEIVAGMIAEARNRKWQIDGRPLLTILARVGTLTPLGVRFARAWAGKVVIEAIEYCESEAP